MLLLVITDDVDYGKALLNAVAIFRPGIAVSLMKKSAAGEGVREPALSGNTPDLILLDGSPSADHPKTLWEEQGCPVLYLTERQRWRADPENVPTVYKFDSVRSILRAAATVSGGKNLSYSWVPEDKRTRMLAVTGARGGTGKTAVSLGIATELCLFHQCRVLYLNGSEMDLPEEWHPQELLNPYTSGSLDRYLYCRERDGAVTGADFFRETSRGVRYFYPSGRCNPLARLTEEECGRFLEELGERNHLDWIVADFTFSGTRLSRQLFHRADRLCYITDRPLTERDPADGIRDRELLALLNREGKKPCCYILNRRLPELPGEEEQQKQKKGGYSEPSIPEKEGNGPLLEMGWDDAALRLSRLTEGAADHGPFGRTMREMGRWMIEEEPGI